MSNTDPAKTLLKIWINKAIGKNYRFIKKQKIEKNKQACEWERFCSMYCIYYEALVYEVVTC